MSKLPRNTSFSPTNTDIIEAASEARKRKNSENEVANGEKSGMMKVFTGEHIVTYSILHFVHFRESEIVDCMGAQFLLSDQFDCLSASVDFAIYFFHVGQAS